MFTFGLLFSQGLSLYKVAASPLNELAESNAEQPTDINFTSNWFINQTMNLIWNSTSTAIQKISFFYDTFFENSKINTEQLKNIIIRTENTLNYLKRIVNNIRTNCKNKEFKNDCNKLGDTITWMRNTFEKIKAHSESANAMVDLQTMNSDIHKIDQNLKFLHDMNANLFGLNPFNIDIDYDEIITAVD